MSWLFMNDYVHVLEDVDCYEQPKNSWECSATCNYGPMLRKIAEMSDMEGIHPDKHLKSISNCNNVTAGEVIFKFWTIALQNRDILEDLEPENGWGTYEQLCELLQDMHIRNTRCLSTNFVWNIY